MKKNYLLVFITTFLLTFISVAYAAFNSELTISGSGIVEKDTTPPTCGTWYLRDSNLTIQEAYNQNKFTNPSTNTSWTTTNQKLFIECSDNMPGSYGCIDVTEITDSNNNPRYFKEVKEYTTSIKTDSEVITVKLKDAYLNEKTCTLPVGGSNPYIDKQAPVVTITQTAANKFTYSVTDDMGVQGYMVTTSSTAPALDDPNWLTEPAEVTIDNTAAKTYYVWAKDGVNVSYQTINTYLLTRTQGTGTTLTLKYNNNSGTPITNSMYVLSGTPVYVTGSLSTGYNTLVLKKDSTTITSPSTQTISSATTISSSASANTYTVSYDANGGSGTMASQIITYNSNTSLTTNTFTRSGYTFAGWNTASDGTGTDYTDGQTKSNITSTNNGTVTLYAKWTANSYTVTANSNGGSIASTTGWTGTGNTSTKSVTYDAAYGTLPTVSKTGYTLAGWSLLPEGYTQVEYIESSKTQYIDTNFIPSDDGGRIETKLSLLTSPGINLYGVENTTTPWNCLGTRAVGGKLIVLTYNDSTTTFTFQTDETYEIEHEYDRLTSTSQHIKFKVNGATIFDKNSSSNNIIQQDNLYIFADNMAGPTRYSAIRLYYFNIYDENDNLVREFIPCINNSTGKAGLYDLVNGVFYESGSNTDFTAGTASYINAESIVKTPGNHNIYAKWTDNTAPVVVTATASSTWDIENYVDFNATDDGSGIVGYNITTTTTAPTTWIPVVDAVETATETKYELDAAWARVFHHNTHWGTVMYSNANSWAEAKSSNTTDKYSVLGNLENYKNVDTWEFLLQYPDLGVTKYNRWIQTDNPTTKSGALANYTAIHADWTASSWGGIALSSNNGTFIDGSPAASIWYYAIGAKTAFCGGIPGPSGSISNVNLWSRIDNLENTSSTNLSRRIGDIKENGTYYVWVIDASGNTAYKAVTVSNVDTTAPGTATITSTNNVAASQTATLTLGDNIGVTKYYWGTSNPATTNVSYISITSTTSTTINKTVSGGEKYFLGLQDAAGNRKVVNMIFYKTTLNTNGGTVSPTSVITMNGNSFALPTPTRTGYTFDGWYTDEELTTPVTLTSGNYKPTSSITLYAKWAANELIFDNKTIGSTYDPSSSQTITNGIDDATNGTGTYTYAITGGNSNNYFSLDGRDIVIAANTPVNTTGYSITITATDSNSGATKDATYYIVINRRKPTIILTDSTKALTYPTAGTNAYTYDGDGTVSCSSSDETYVTCSVDTTNNVINVVPVKPTSSAITITVSATAGANYSAPNTKTFTVTVAKGTCPAPSNVVIATAGTVTWTTPTGASSSQISINNTNFATATSGVDYKSTIIAATGTRTVYVRSACDTTYYSSANSSSVSSSTTVYKVTLTAGTGISSVTGAGNYITGASASINATVSAGYTWANWTGSSTISTKSTSVTVNANKTYTANAIPNTYTIVFNKNNNAATGTMSGQIMTYDNETTLTPNEYELEGYYFVGWNTEANGTGTSYADEASVSNLATSGTFNLYAQWKEKAKFNEGPIINLRMKQLAGDSVTGTYPTFNESYYQINDTNISSVVRSTTEPSSSIKISANDVSVTNTPIYMWYDNGTIYWWSEDSNPYLNENSEGLFSCLRSLSNVDLTHFDTSIATSFSYMFELNISLTSIDLSNYNTTNVTSYNGMFVGMASLTSIDLSSFDMSSTVDSGYMFDDDTSLATIVTPNTYSSDSGFGIDLPFRYKDSNNNIYTSLDNSSPTSTTLTRTITMLDTGANVNVKLKRLAGQSNPTVNTVNDNIQYVLPSSEEPSASNKTSEHVISSSTSAYPVYAWYDGGDIYIWSEDDIYFNPNSESLFNNMTAIFGFESNYARPTLIQDADYMFNNCSSLQSINLYDYIGPTTSSVTGMLNGTLPNTIITPDYINGVTITLPDNYSDGTNYYTYLDSNAPGGATLTRVMAKFDTGQNVNLKMKQLTGNSVGNFWEGDNTITSIVKSDVEPSAANKTSEHIVSTQDSGVPIYMWYDNGTIYWWSLSTHPYLNEDASYMFAYLNNLSSIDVSSFDTSNVTNFYGMFSYISALTSLDLSSFDMSSATDGGYMFAYDYSLMTIVTPNSYPSDSSVGIELGAEFKDTSNNVYTELTNTSPTTTTLTRTITMLDTGPNVNVKLKALAGNSNPTVNTVDTNIIAISWSDDEPSAENKTSEHIISSSTSAYPIYAWYVPSTSVSIMYLWSEVGPYDIYLNQNSESLFSNMNSLGMLKLYLIPVFVHDVDYLFKGCSSLDSIDLSSYIWSGVTSTTDILDGTNAYSIYTPGIYPSNSNVIIDLEHSYYEYYNHSNIHTSLNNTSPKYTELVKALVVTFDAGSASVSPSSKVVVPDTQYGELPTPTNIPTGYEFKGWIYDDYEEVEYIESTGTQYINIGYTGGSSVGFDIDFNTSSTISTSSGFGTIFGARTNYYQRGYQLTTYGDSSLKGHFLYGTSTTSNVANIRNSAGIVPGTRQQISFRSGTRVLTLPDSSTKTLTYASYFTTPKTLYIFALNENGTVGEYSKTKLYSFKLYNSSGVMTHNYIPVINKSTGKAGLYDTVTNTFKGNSGTGDFIAGPRKYVTSSSIVYKDTDHTLAADYNLQDYTITYNLNGGYQSSGSACASENGTCSFTGTKFVCYGGANNYVCKNATTSIACTTAAFGSDPTPGLAKSCYVSDNPVAYDVETATITLAAPTKSGSTFTGWTGSNGSTPQTSVTIPAGSTGNKTYTANWSTTNYTLTARTTYGTINATSGWTKVSDTRYTKTLANGSIYGTLPTATRSGYLLKGWYTASSGGTQVTQTTIISSNKTIYAQWTKVDSTSKTFSYTGAVQTYVAPSAGTYKLEVCGAQGGSPSVAGYTRAGGNGGCATGNVSLSAGQTLYVFVGGQGNCTNGNSGAAAGGWNGGGATGGTNSATWYGSGGGATHISKTNATIANAGNNLLIVGGGGGGGLLYYASDGTNTSLWFNGVGGAGGGSSGGTGVCHDERNGQCYGAAGTGGSQSGPGGGGASGSKGQGGTSSSGGGGGFYGGGGGNAGGAGGGSGYVGGVSSASWSSSSCQNSGTTRTGNGCAKITKQ